MEVSAYRSLSAFKTREITDILKQDTLFAVGLCLFSAENGALFARKRNDGLGLASVRLTLGKGST